VEAVEAVLDQAYVRQASGQRPGIVKQTSFRRGRGHSPAAGSASVAEAAKLTTQLQAFRSEGFLCDLVISVAGKSIIAHQAVLAAASIPFREFALDGLAEPSAASSSMPKANSNNRGEGSTTPLDTVQSIEMELGGILHAEAVHAMLDHIYVSSTPAQWPQTVGANKDVLALSDAFELPALAEEARAWLRSHGFREEETASGRHSPLSPGPHRKASIASITHPLAPKDPFEVGCTVLTATRALIREGEDLSSPPVLELAAGTKCVVLGNGHGVNAHRVHARVIESGREGWLSRMSKGGTTLLEIATSDSTNRDITVAATFEVGSLVVTASKAMMRHGEDLTSKPVEELAARTPCVVLTTARGVNGLRVLVRVIDSGRAGWLSRVSKGGTTLLEPVTSDALIGDRVATARTFEVGSSAVTISKALMRRGEDLSSRPLAELPPGIVCAILGRGHGTDVQRVHARIAETGQEGWLSTTSKNGGILLAPCRAAAATGALDLHTQPRSEQHLRGAQPLPAKKTQAQHAVASAMHQVKESADAAPSTPRARATGAEHGAPSSPIAQLIPPKAVKRRREAGADDEGGKSKVPRKAAGTQNRAVCKIS